MRKHVADIKYVCNPLVFTFLLHSKRLNKIWNKQKKYLTISMFVLTCSGIELRGFVNARSSVPNTSIFRFCVP
jgi:hypothetical protein